MKSRSAMAAFAASLLVFGAGQATGQDSGNSDRARQSVDRVAVLTLDTLAGQLAALEVERTTLLRQYSSESEHVSLLDRRRQALCEALDELPQGSAKAHEFAAARIVDAIEEKLAGLAVDRRLLRVERSASHPDLLALDASIAELERRRRELNVLATGRVCPNSVRR